MVDRIVIGSIRKMLTSRPSIAYEDASLIDIARIMVEDPKSRAVYIVNKNKILKGIIPIMTLIEYLFQNYLPEHFIDIFTSYHLLTLMSAEKASEIMISPVYAKNEDNLATAIKKMYENKIKELPIVDNKLRIIGNLNMLEVLQIWIKKEEGKIRTHTS